MRRGHNEPARLLADLIAAAPILANGEKAAAQVLADFLRRAGIEAQVDVWDKRRANLIAILKSNQKTAAPLWIAGHLDVVPADGDGWQTDPFKPTVRGGRMYGRGATDMLGGLAAVSAALARLAQDRRPLNRDIVLLATAGEETDSCGAKRLMADFGRSAPAPCGVIVPEPTDMHVVYAHRGIVWLRLSTRGKSAHGSMPHLGVNAILKMNRLIDLLSRRVPPHTPHPVLGGCSMSLNRIAGGSGVNIVPDRCHLDIDIRILPGQTDRQMIDFLKSVCRQAAAADRQIKTDISVLRHCPPLFTPPDAPFVKTVCRALGKRKPKPVRFTTDAPYFAVAAPAVIVGPGDSAACHQRDESISLQVLRDATDAFACLFESL